MNMHILYVGQGPDVMMLTEFMMRRHCQVEHCHDLGKIVPLIQHRAGKGNPYNIILLDEESIGPAAIEMIGQVRHAQNDASVALLVDFTQVDALRAAATQQGCSRLFEKPIDLSQLERYLHDVEHARNAGLTGHTTSGSHPLLDDEYAPTTSPYQRGGQNTGHEPSGHVQQLSGRQAQLGTPHSGTNSLQDSSGYQRTHSDGGPFFGTGRARRSATGTGESSGSLRSISGGYRRTNSGYDPNSRELGVSETAKVRRSVTGSFKDDGSGSHYTQAKSANIPAEGPIDPNAIQPDAPPTKKVACAHCKQTFRVMRKNEPFTMPCIHCGQLNRIMP